MDDEQLLEVTARAVQPVMDWGESGLAVADGLLNLLKVSKRRMQICEFFFFHVPVPLVVDMCAYKLLFIAKRGPPKQLLSMSMQWQIALNHLTFFLEA